MMRTALGLSFSVVLVLGSAIACGSSKTTDDNGSSTAGNGSILTGGSGGGLFDGGGAANSGAGTSRGGTPAGGGATGTAGATSGGGKCADQSVTCVDATHAKGCNLDTGVIETFDCVAELQALGIVSSGCTKDATTGDSCTIDSFSDAACLDGTQRIAYCENATNEEALNVYISCFTDFMDAHTVVPCFSQYVTDTMKTAGNCADAENACFGIGAGGVGAGGSP
jgi:hypothetical protein